MKARNAFYSDRPMTKKESPFALTGKKGRKATTASCTSKQRLEKAWREKDYGFCHG